MAATAPVGHRCRVRLEDLQAEGRRIRRLERRQLPNLQEFAGRLERLRANIERYTSEMDWLSPETKELVRTELAEMRSEIAEIREGGDG